MKLKELLEKCLGRKINTIYIGDNKLFPHDDGEMIISTTGASGYYAILSGTKYLLCISIMEGAGKEEKKMGFTAIYDNDGETIRSIHFGGYKIYFDI